MYSLLNCTGAPLRVDVNESIHSFVINGENCQGISLLLSTIHHFVPLLFILLGCEPEPFEWQRSTQSPNDWMTRYFHPAEIHKQMTLTAIKQL